MTKLIDPREFTATVTLLREFFTEKGFLEVHTQNRLSILAACEDPTTVATYDYAGSVWPLPQTGQMWLEYEILKDPTLPGVFCVSTSYRQEPDPIPGRHDLIFPMFEFETKGTVADLERTLIEICDYLGFGDAANFKRLDYEDAAAELGVQEIKGTHEEDLGKKYGPVVLLKNFPLYTSPFWNMKSDGTTANKIDVLLYGMETIGSSERSSDVDAMRQQFHTISDGLYAKTLFARFTHERVEKELEDFLSLNFFPRYGGGIGVTRLIRALKLSGQL